MDSVIRTSFHSVGMQLPGIFSLTDTGDEILATTSQKSEMLMIESLMTVFFGRWLKALSLMIIRQNFGLPR
jgi:hypothetical protein